MIIREDLLEIGKIYKVKFTSCDGCAGGEFTARLLDTEEELHWSNGLMVWWENFVAEEVIEEIVDLEKEPAV